MSDSDLNVEFCCTCLKVGAVGDKFVSLSFEPPADVSYRSKLKSCVPEMGLDNTDDCFLCKPCSAALETAYTFRCMCLRTETRLGEFRVSKKNNLEENIQQEVVELCVVEENSSSITQLESFSKDFTKLNAITNKEPDDLKSTRSDFSGNSNSHVFDNQSQISNSSGYNSINGTILATNRLLEKNVQHDTSLGKALSDAEIIENFCKANPDLHNCSPEALDCRVTLEQTEVTDQPVLLPSSRKNVKNKGRPYWCTVCQKDVYRRERYHAHILRHSNIRAYKCNICRQGFFSSETLTKHEKGCTGVYQKYGKKLADKKIEDTKIKVEIPDEYVEEKTPTPPKNAIRKSTRPQIPSRKFSLNETTFNCKHCNFQSSYKQKYEAHLLTHQNVEEATTASQENPAPTSDNDWDTNCISNFLGPAVSLFVNPGKVVTPIIQSIHSLAETSTQDNSLELSYSCKRCNISFKSRNLLMLHTQTHDLKRSCEICQKEFISESEFIAHQCSTTSQQQDSMETSEPPKMIKKKIKRKYFCQVCNMEFASRDHGNIHTGAKPYVCKVCSKHFAAYTTLRKHLRTHLEKPQPSASAKKRVGQAPPVRKTYSCDICKKVFVNKENIYAHNCQNASGDSVYRCQICKNTFIGRAALIEHMGVHVKTECSE